MNLLYIFTDQMHRYAMRCMGTSDISTPTLDALAADGVLFRSAYSNCPICTPYRISLFTGRYTSGSTNDFSNNSRIPDGMRTLADEFNDGGYRTSFVGKWHIGGNGNTPIPPALRGGFTDFIGYQCYNGFLHNVCFYDEDHCEHRFDQHRTEVTTDLAIERLQRIADQPFAMFVAYQAPHYPEQPIPEFDAMYRDVTLTRRPNCQEIDPYTRTWNPPSPWPPEGCPDYQRYGNNLDEYLRLYYGMVSGVDAHIARLFDALEALGRWDDTVVIFTSDHGDMQGSHGLKNKCLPYEESSGVPLIIRVPGGARGVVCDAPVSGIDMYPTCVDFAGLPLPTHLPGRTLAPITRGESLALTDPVFSEMAQWVMVRHGDLKLVVDRPELRPTAFYDLARDPYELHNLLDDPSQHQAIAALHALVVSWQQAATDVPV